MYAMLFSAVQCLFNIVQGIMASESEVRTGSEFKASSASRTSKRPEVATGCHGGRHSDRQWMGLN